MSLVVGITGKYCAGKDRVAGFLAARGWRLINVDRLGHEALEDEELRKRVTGLFGEGILDGQGRISRAQLGAVVFADPEKLALLEALVHPWMRERTAELIASAKEDGVKVAVHAALLAKMQLVPMCDAVVWVEAPAWLRFLRGLRRDGFHPGSVLKKMSSQKHISAQLFSQGVDTYSVVNTPAAKSLAVQLAFLVNRAEK